MGLPIGIEAHSIYCKIDHFRCSEKDYQILGNTMLEISDIL